MTVTATSAKCVLPPSSTLPCTCIFDVNTARSAKLVNVKGTRMVSFVTNFVQIDMIRFSTKGFQVEVPIYAMRDAEDTQDVAFTVMTQVCPSFICMFR